MKKKLALLVFALLLVLTACSPKNVEPTSGNPLGGEAYVDSAELAVMESYPVQVSVHLIGSTPTPCHEFRYQYETQIFGETNRIDITVYSESDPEAVCIQVLEPFDESISLDMINQPDGLYEVYVNGELIGEFSYPG